MSRVVITGSADGLGLAARPAGPSGRVRRRRRRCHRWLRDRVRETILAAGNP